MNDKQIIRDFYGRTLGTITTDAQGNKEVRDFYGHLLGRYDAKSDITRDFYGRTVARGDRASSLIPATRK